MHEINIRVTIFSKIIFNVLKTILEVMENHNFS